MRCLTVLIAAFLTTCGPGPAEEAPAPAEITSSDFVLLPCKALQVEAKCALAIVGGKMLLFGAPAGVGFGLPEERLAGLDAVILFSLDADNLEGLDEVRNASWRAGRARPLKVIGPDGTLEVVRAINQAFEMADAAAVVAHGLPPGGFDAALLAPSEAEFGGGILFDTGDVRVAGDSDWSIGLGGQLRLNYQASGTALIFGACDDQETSLSAKVWAEIKMNCAEEAPGLVWPLTETVWLGSD